MCIDKRVIKGICTVVCILVFLSCEDKKYNYELISEEGELLMEGNVNKNFIPNGEFVFYNDKKNIESIGVYDNGIKKGEWKYFLHYFDKEIIWRKHEIFDFKFPLSSKYVIKDFDSLFYAEKIFSGANKSNFFSIRRHDKYDVDNDFDNYCQVFVKDIIQKNNARSNIDFSKHIKDTFGVKNLLFLIFDCLDDQRGKYYFLVLLVEKEPGILVEVELFTMNDSIDREIYFFKEVISDIYMNNDLLLKKRWGELR